MCTIEVLARQLGTKLQEKVFSGEKLDVIHFWILGCPIFIQVPKEKWTKLEASRRKGIFVGYSETSKAFKIYIPSFKQIETSEDVTFDED